MQELHKASRVQELHKASRVQEPHRRPPLERRKVKGRLAEAPVHLRAGGLEALRDVVVVSVVGPPSRRKQAPRT